MVRQATRQFCRLREVHSPLYGRRASGENGRKLTASTHVVGSESPPDGLPELNSATLLPSPTALTYASGRTLALNTAAINYFTGRSDNFGTGNLLNPNDGRLDPEGIRVSNVGKSVFVSDE